MRLRLRFEILKQIWRLQSARDLRLATGALNLTEGFGVLLKDRADIYRLEVGELFDFGVDDVVVFFTAVCTAVLRSALRALICAGSLV